MSGYVSAIAYGRVLRERGFFSCQAKGVRRSLQLYAAHVVTVLLLCGVMRLIDSVVPGLASTSGLGEINVRWRDPRRTFENVLLLKFVPGNFEILPLYSLFLLALPPILWLARGSGTQIVCLSAIPYVAALLWPEAVSLPNAWAREWVFNPWAWQFLFFLGVGIGVGGMLRPLFRAQSAWLIFAAVVVVEASFFQKLFAPGWTAFDGKRNCEPARILHLWALVVCGDLLFRWSRLSIADVRGWSRDGRTTVQMRVDFHSTSATGEFGGHVQIPQVDASVPAATIPIRAVVSEPVRLSPQIAFFGTVTPGDNPTRTIRVEAVDQKKKNLSEVTVVGVRTPGERFKTKLDVKDASISLSLNSAMLPPGVFRDEIDLLCRFKEKEYRLRLPVRALIRRNQHVVVPSP